MMKLTDYLHKLATDKNMVCDDRILYLEETKHHLRFTSVLTLMDVDEEGARYVFAGEEPFHDFETIIVIRAYTTTKCMNLMLGLESLTEDFTESEVE